jgi:hypothetical protein
MCEIYNQLKACGFSDSGKCIYESGCPFKGVSYVGEVDVPTQCQAATDAINSKAETPDDIDIENFIKSMVSVNRVN